MSLVLAFSLVTAGQPPALIPRDVLFGNPDRAAARISPDGARLAWLAPLDGVLNVWVAPVDDLGAAKPVTQDKGRGIRSYFWAFTNRHIVYVQDKDGDENWRVYAVDLASGETRDLTPLEGVSARIDDVSHRFPGEILVGLNDRNPQLHDLWRVDLATGERNLVQENPGFAGFLTDDDYRVRYGMRFLPDGSFEVLQRREDGEFEPVETIPPEDTLTTQAVGFDKTGRVLYQLDSRGRDTAALYTIDIASGEKTLVFEDPRADVSGIQVHPTEKTIQAVSSTYEKTEWKALEPAFGADLERLRAVSDGEITVASRTLDDRRWVVAFVDDDGPVRYYLYDRDTQQARFLFTNRTALEGLPLMPMHPVVIPARDGLNLVCYLSLPAGSDSDGNGRPDRPVPLVLNVHGGPWHRDSWGYHSEHQWLANRGYAVLSVNFRGSTGFGKRFLNAGSQEWGRKMHDDLIDAVDWAIAQGIADPAKVAIYGGSYGGYATLAGLTFTPEKFAAGVDIVGPSNLITLLNSFPPYWAPMKQVFVDRVGNPDTEEGRALLTERSPLTHVERIQRPLLIAQGANDPRVKQAEADQIVDAMQAKDIPVTYVLYPDEGHGFARPENRQSFYAIAEAFLAEHLGGRFEPVGDDFAGSSLKVVTGADEVPGLAAALAGEASGEAAGSAGAGTSAPSLAWPPRPRKR